MKVRDCFELNPLKNKNTFKGFINYIDTSSVQNGTLINVSFLENEFPSRAQRIVKYNDILYSSVRPNLRHYYLYQDDFEHAVASTGFVLLRRKNNCNVKFIFYYLSTNEVVQHLSNIAEMSQSTFPSFSSKDLGKIDLPMIDEYKQKSIVDILACYDSLIDNNNKRIKVLEQMAEHLYKEWFVRFRFPGHENTEFENGIPKGWNYFKFSTVYKTIRGVSYTSEEIDCDTGENLINLKNIKAFGGFRKDGTKKYCGRFKQEQVVRKNDLVMGVTDMTQDRRTVGSVALVPDIEGVISADLILLKSSLSNIFSYYLIKAGGYSRLFSEFGNGANVIHLKPGQINNQKILIPSVDTINQFVKIVDKIINQINALEQKNDNLSKQRDLLLPRLMSGKLEV